MVGFSIGPKIDLDGNNSCRILTWDSGGCRPAHKTEIALWAENEALRAELEAMKAEREVQRESKHYAQRCCELAESELARLKDRVAGWDIDATADCIARNLSAVKGGRYHATAYSAAKANAIEALKLAQANLTTDNSGGDTAREGGR